MMYQYETLRWILFWTFYQRMHSLSVSGTIENETAFFYRKIPTESPSSSATIDYAVTFPRNLKYVNLGVYTTEDHINLQNRCTCHMYEQLGNKKMQTELDFLRNSCILSHDKLSCNSRIIVWDYRPRKFGFSLGFYCEDTWKSLKGLTYNITVTTQTIQPTCTPMPETVVDCSKYFLFVSFPNLLSHVDSEKATFSFNRFYQVYQLLDLSCYPHFEELFCNMYYPNCDPETQSITVPCKETCEEMTKGCLPEVERQLPVDSFMTQCLPVDSFMTSLFTKAFNCSYLPSRNSSYSCFYKPVLCDSPPNVTDIVIIDALNKSAPYTGGTEVEYACADDHKDMTGSNKVTCMYNGEWSGTPVCVPVSETGKTLLKVLPPAFATLLVFSVFSFIIFTRRRHKEKLIRRRHFDALVCCHFDTDNDFVIETLIPELEDNDPGFKLCVHFRDFEPGRKIMQNIREAITNSNGSIILLSQGFVDSEWCQEEFEECCTENKKDPAFLMLVILMQEVKTLMNVPECMANFVKQDTYLEKDDPDLIKKISKCLTQIKQGKGDVKKIEKWEEIEMEEMI